MSIKMSYDKNTAIRIKNFLLSNGLTLEGTYGLMANLYTESGFRSNNAQNSCMTKLGMTDEIYTTKVDNGEYSNFIFDRVGYGICQWTSSGRKQNLINYAKSCGKSIGDETMQLNFLMQELSTGYRSVLKVLTASHDISECAKYVMTKFERPANQSKENQNKRAKYGIQLFNELETKCSNQTSQGGNKMEYTNSSLVTYTKLSPNKTSPRTHAIDTITIHCMAGNLSVETCGNVFANKSRQASSNYGIGSDGRIALYVNESDRSWCSSNKANDHRAVTIEVANDGGAPEWHVSDKAMTSLIELVADICKRNNIKELKWKGNKNLIGQVDKQNMTVHRWFAAKACPGQYLYNKHSYIAGEVNKKLGVYSSTVSNTSPSTASTYTVVKGDTLSKIGKKTGIAWKSIANLNGIKSPYTLKIGQVLILTNSTNSTSSFYSGTSITSTKKYIYNGVDYSPVFDPTYYANKYPDLKKAFGTNATALFNHFVKYGAKEKRQASAAFNVEVYKNSYVDLQKAFGDNYPEYYKHYIQFGRKEGRKAV